MECVLLRHGIAVERNEWEGPDADRPPTERVAQVVGRKGFFPLRIRRLRQY